MLMFSQNPMTSSKTLGMPQLCCHPQKSSHPKLFNFLKLKHCKTFRNFRGFKQFSIPIGWLVMAGCVRANIFGLRGLKARNRNTYMDETSRDQADWNIKCKGMNNIA